jgi:hypothetical protein
MLNIAVPIQLTMKKILLFLLASSFLVASFGQNKEVKDKNAKNDKDTAQTCKVNTKSSKHCARPSKKS